MNAVADAFKANALGHAATLRGLTLGDIVETEGLFQGADAEPLRWLLVGGNFEAGEYVFDVSYFGVFLGQFRAQITGDAIEFEEV